MAFTIIYGPGLLAVAKSFCRDFEQEYADIKLKIRMDAEEADIPFHLKKTIFSIIQDSFSNIIKHGGVTLVNLTILKRKKA